MIHFEVPLLGFCAYSGTGKTTLLKKLVPLLKKQGLGLAIIKHSHHDFEIDYPGKDSYELRHAGAEQMLIVSQHRLAHIVEYHGRHEAPPLSEILPKLDTDNVNLVLVEGYRHECFPKIELHRPSLAKPLIYPDDKNVIAVASDEPLTPDEAMPTLLDLNNDSAIVDFILGFVSPDGK
ncbi:MAG TPA: molybdopterin-guanine dinucleotide biosynthesis protein B [Gammaproteobacteria bacterium]|nr:molybdopterin-guanine dinucleotide biosynthesis protein B [Gammaproteobacteria bacterium]